MLPGQHPVTQGQVTTKVAEPASLVSKPKGLFYGWWIVTAHLAQARADLGTFSRKTVNHSAEEWVRGDVHTNSVEGIWSLLKRSIVGSYHKLSVKHLDSYLDELEWRFNNRENPYLFRDTLLKLIQSDNLTYNQLKAK